LNEKIKKMLQPPSTPAPSQVVNHQGTFTLCVDTPIVDANGVQMGYLGQIMEELMLLRDKNVKIRDEQVKMGAEIDGIKADVTAGWHDVGPPHLQLRGPSSADCDERVPSGARICFVRGPGLDLLS
jgi:hypothetical protein